MIRRNFFVTGEKLIETTQKPFRIPRQDFLTPSGGNSPPFPIDEGIYIATNTEFENVDFGSDGETAAKNVTEILFGFAKKTTGRSVGHV